jgi:hypothetical protein
MGLAMQLEQALLIGETEMLTGDWAADTDRAVSIADRVRSTWSGVGDSSQIQYYDYGDGAGYLLLLTRPLNGLLLTLAAEATMAISRLRRYADELIGRLLNDGGSPIESAVARSRAGQSYARANGSAYAIAWRPVEPMPQALRGAVRESVGRLAREHGCHVSFAGVASDHVHLVLNCPSHRSSSWAAFAFKSGIEDEIRRRTETTRPLWRKGYLANPSTEPLAGEELLVYLSSSV